MSWLFGTAEEPATHAERLLEEVEENGHFGCLIEIKALHALVRNDTNSHAHFGQDGMKVLVSVLKTEGNGPETMRTTLNILLTLMSAGPAGQENCGFFLFHSLSLSSHLFC